jgi:hypothetical protein
VGEAVPSQHHYSANSHRIAIALLVQDGDRNAVTVNERKINSGKRYTQASRMKVPAQVGWTYESLVSPQMGTKKTVVFS